VAALLDRPAAEVYKTDARSRVWRVETERGPVVIKRFEFSAVRQRLGALLGVHPAQRERRWNARLASLGIPVAPILAHGWLGGKRFLIYPYVGPSLHWVMRQRSGPARHAALRSAAEITAALIRAKLFNRDHKASNMLVDAEGKAYLTDVGGIRAFREGAAEAMLASLDESLARAGGTRGDRWRVGLEVVRRCPELRDVRDVARSIRDSRNRKRVC
jgi:hypothetical protein